MTRTPTRELILAAAVRTAAEKGITGASMDEIAERAGVAKGSLYYNFPSKDAIFGQVVRDGFDRLDAALRTARGDAKGLSAMRAVTVATLEVLSDSPDRAKIVAAEIFRTDRPWADVVAPVRAGVVVHYREVLQEYAADRGEATDAITDVAGAAFLGAIAGAGLEWLLFHKERPLPEVADQVLALMPR